MAVAYLRTKGVVSGYADGTFHPDQPINRAEFVKILVKSLVDQSEIDNCFSTLNQPDHWGRVQYTEFNDVQLNDWFVPYLCIARQRVAIEGYPDHRFRPGKNVNFAESAKILSRTIGHQWNKNRSDVSAVWYREFVLNLEDDRAIPLSIHRFDQQITRGEMAEMVWRLKENIQDKPTRTYEEMAERANVDLWKTFMNERYGYSVSYPAELNVYSEDFGGAMLPENSAIIAIGRLMIYPRDEESFSGMTGQKKEDALRIIRLPIREYAQAIYDRNFPIPRSTLQQQVWREVGELEEITIAGRPAFRFTVLGSFDTESGGGILEDARTIVMFTNGKMNFRAEYDAKSVAADQILRSLTFNR